MERFRQLVRRIYARLDALEVWWKLVVRAGVGLMFLGSGLIKFGKLQEFVEYFRSLGIPAPALQAPFVATVELVAGSCLIIGLLTRPAALMLSGVMVVALLTAGIPDHHITATWRGLLDFLYLPDWLLLLLLGWLITSGAGRLSLDQRLARKA